MSLIIDPPYGWLHGFPKVVPEEIRNDSRKINEWLVENGYTIEEVESKWFYVRMWESDD
jgi:hypothetical protein